MKQKSSSSRSSKPHGIIPWIRRRVLPMLAKSIAFIGILTLITWIGGRIITDEYRWSQFLWWIPSTWMILSAWICLVCSSVLAKLGRRLGGIIMRPMLLVLCIGCTLYLIFGVWNMHRVIGGDSIPSDSLRIVHWNQAGFKADQEAWGNHLIDIEADLVLVANSQWGRDRNRLLNTLSGIAPDDQEHIVEKGFRVHGKLGHFRIDHDAMIVSKYPIVRTARVVMGSRAEQESVFNRGSDYGWITMIELDTTDLRSAQNTARSTTIVWMVDLPSNPTLWRQESMRDMRSALDKWGGTEFYTYRSNRNVSVWVPRASKDTEFPSPDIVIGDFNTPSGSNSIHQLIPDMNNAYEIAGHGPSGSWRPKIRNKFLRQPFKIANWHIDLALSTPESRVNKYSLHNAQEWGASEHKMQILDISPQIGKTSE